VNEERKLTLELANVPIALAHGRAKLCNFVEVRLKTLATHATHEQKQTHDGGAHVNLLITHCSTY
jgi:hypothetical protein